MGENAELSVNHKRAWAFFLRSHAALIRRMEMLVRANGGLPLDLYDVLLTLEESAYGRLTMSELAEKVILSPSGVTRLIDRLEKQGFVARDVNPADRRSMFAVLTPAGRVARETAWPIYHKVIKTEFACKLTSEEAASLATLLKRYLHPDIGVDVWS